MAADADGDVADDTLEGAVMSAGDVAVLQRNGGANVYVTSSVT